MDVSKGLPALIGGLESEFSRPCGQDSGQAREALASGTKLRGAKELSNQVKSQSNAMLFEIKAQKT